MSLAIFYFQMIVLNKNRCIHCQPATEKESVKLRKHHDVIYVLLGARLCYIMLGVLLLLKEEEECRMFVRLHKKREREKNLCSKHLIIFRVYQIILPQNAAVYIPFLDGQNIYSNLTTWIIYEKQNDSERIFSVQRKKSLYLSACSDTIEHGTFFVFALIYSFPIGAAIFGCNYFINKKIHAYRLISIQNYKIELQQNELNWFFDLQ